ncbi:alpha/beta hydrolase [Phytomonospora sp. NPDC050363]|uniref:alpha/beta fold hydrolase n=1 Tax=Phytomonospora sp. NPDC050363 TaxID=3155642 RepID=UPI0033ECB3AB
MPTHLLAVNGTRLFVDERGDASAPPLLFIHGGPGQSAFTFTHFQIGYLAATLRVFAVDQRGLLRSDPLPEGTEISVDALIADFEEIRRALGVERWTIVGHSAGGHTAVRYACEHPEAVSGVILDCPALDSDLTDRHRLPVAATLLDEIGEHEAAEKCRAFAARPGRLTAEDKTYEAMLPLGARYNELFFASQAHIDAYDKAHDASGFSGEDWGRGATHLALLPDMYKPLFGLLPTPQPSLLVHGRADLVAAPAVIEAYRAGAPNGGVHTFENSGHFPYIEEPEAYAEVVSRFASAVAKGTDPHA